jgi:histidyl-tRNA synthetase
MARFGSVGGGRYDGPAFAANGAGQGFSIGVSRLLAALEHLGKVVSKAEAGPVVVTVFDKDRADRRNSACVIIQGSDEKAKGEVTIKDLVIGAELANLEKGREEHLQKQAQSSVAEAELVEAVRSVLARTSRAEMRHSATVAHAPQVRE